jgi:hypothetical protein
MKPEFSQATRSLRAAGLAIAACLLVTDAAAREPPGDEASSFYESLFGGQIRALLRYSGQYRNSSLHLLQDSSAPDVPDESVQQYSAIGGFAGYETRPWKGLTIGATVYVSLPAGNNPSERRGLGGLYEGDGAQDPYAALGEAYVRFRKDGHHVRAGRQEIPAYRYVSLSDIRMSPITHAGVVYENRSSKAWDINLGYVARMKERNDWRFIDMARGARLRESDRGKQIIRGDYDPDHFDESGYIGPSKEMLMAGVVHHGERFTLEAWDYLVRDFANTLYLYGQYRHETDSGLNWDLAAQYSNQRDVGGHVGGNIDTWHYGLRLGISGKAFNAFAAWNEVAYNEGSYDGGTLFVRWGTPQMFNSFQVQDAELAGTRAFGVGFQYDFGLNDILPGTVMRWRWGHYDMPDRLYMTDARQDRSEATIDLRYSFGTPSGFDIFTQLPGWSIQFRLAWNNYRTDYDFEAYQEIHGYDFESVTKDFYDARLYIEYRF